MTGLVIFDCDGVLIDSEILAADALIAELAGIGHAIDRDHVRREFLGRSFPSVAAKLAEDLGRPLPEGFETAYRARLLARFETDLRPTPGLSALLDRLTIPACVATSSSPERARRSLAIAGLTDRLPRVFTASEVTRGKPAPDLFLHAARQMGHPPEACLVVEDSPPGLAAARAAGMAVLHYTGGAHLRGRAATPPGVTGFDNWADFDQLIGLGTGVQPRAPG